MRAFVPLFVLATACYTPVEVEMGPDPLADVCRRWEADQEDQDEGQWTGDVDTCEPGELSDVGVANTLKNVNLYRWLAHLPEVDTSPEKNAIAQECSLMMQANSTIDHFPTSSWDCYSQDGSNGAGTSNLATAPAVMAVELYMADSGDNNASSLGHRRWILSNSLGPIGVGSGPNYSCLLVIGGSGSTDRSWTAWPPDGEVPLDAVNFGGQVDFTGWSIQSDSVTLAGATITVERDGEELAGETANLDAGYGSNDAIKFTPDGWVSEAGTYTVRVDGASEDIEYDVTFRDCANE